MTKSNTYLLLVVLTKRLYSGIRDQELLSRFERGEGEREREEREQKEKEEEEVIELLEDKEELILPEISPAQGMELCAQLEMLCLQYPDVSGMHMLVPQTQVQKLCARLRVEENNRQMQTTLNRFWSKDGAPT